MLPLLVTTSDMTPVFNSVALGCRYISPSSTVTARTASVATCVGADTEVGAAAAVFASSAVRSSRLSSNSVDATSTKVTTMVMAMVLNNVSCDGSVDLTNLSFTQSRGGERHSPVTVDVRRVRSRPRTKPRMHHTAHWILPIVPIQT